MKCVFYFPTFDLSDDIIHIASFSSLRKLHDYEAEKIVKIGYGLTLKALNPSTLERQNVKLVLQVFNEHVLNSLKVLGPKHNISHYADTAEFLHIILTWWKIVNVKTPLKGQRLNDPNQMPLTRNDDNIEYLNKFIDWLDRWKHKVNQWAVYQRNLDCFKELNLCNNRNCKLLF